MDGQANGTLYGSGGINISSESKCCNNSSKRFKRRSSKKKCLDMYNNVQLIDCVTTTCSRDDPASLSPSASLISFPSYPSQSNNNCKKNTGSFNEVGCEALGETFVSNHSTSIDDASPSSSLSSITARSPGPLCRTNTLPSHYSLTRSFSVPSHCDSNTTPPWKKLTLFGKKSSELFSPSLRSMPLAPLSDVKVPSPARFVSVYQAVRKGVSEHISVNTAELNVLQVRLQQVESLNAAQSYETEKVNFDSTTVYVGPTASRFLSAKQIKHLERMIKRLQYHQTQLDELHEGYQLQQRYREGAYKLKSALSSSRVSSRSSLSGIKHDLSRCMETLCSLQQELTTLLGRFQLCMKGLLGFARLRAGDHYEVVMRHGTQKWRMRGSVKSSGDQTWDKPECTLQPLLSDVIHIKVLEVKMLGMHTAVGNVTAEIKSLFTVEPQDLLFDLNDTGTLKLSVAVTWSPLDGYETPTGAPQFATFSTASSSRLRTRSVAERPKPPPGLVRSRGRLSVALARPMSAIYSSSSANLNNSNNIEYLDIRPSFPSTCSDVDDTSSKAERRRRSQSPISSRSRSEEQAFLEAISKPAELPSNHKTDSHESDVIQQRPAKLPTASELRVSRQLVTKATEVNLLMDDYRGRRKELQHLEEVLLSLLDQLKLARNNHVVVDGFSVSSDDCGANGNPLIDKKRDDVNPLESFTTSGKLICDQAFLPHLELIQYLMQDVGVFGPLKVREIVALDKLQKQAHILQRLLDIAGQDKEPILEEMEEFTGRRALLEMWRSCCDGSTTFTVSGRTLRLELTSEYSREVRDKHPDVAEKLFSELVRRIHSRNDVIDSETATVTLFQVSGYVSEASDSIHEDLAKIVDKVALEMFITNTLSCGVRELALVAIKRMSSLLALRLSNLRALSHLLLETDCGVRTAAAAHIKHISTEKLLREKAVVFYSELLESSSKRDRQCASIALGFLSANECIEQLAYLCHSDVEAEVREAASNVLLSLGEEGKEARDHASSTLLAQTRSQQVSFRNRSRMGTAL